MFFKWLKQYMPRSLYGRAAMILIVPVVSLQLAVFVVILQRHFEDVTVQLSTSVIRELSFVQSSVDPAASARLLGYAYEPVSGDLPTASMKTFFDLTGIWVIRTFESRMPTLGAVHLDGRNPVKVFMKTDHGPVMVTFERGRVSASNPHQLLVWTLVIGGFMTLISFLFLRNQLRPIKRLATASEEFGKGHHTPFTPTGATEVRAAGKAFLEMRARIERHIEQRTLILSGVSHDLRTPLTRLKLGLSLMDPAEVGDMEKDVADMQRLLEEFLVFARRDLESGFEAEAISPIALVTEVVDAHAGRGEPVTLLPSQAEGKVMLRPFSVRRALDNLIGNAIRYGSKAEVSVIMTERTLTFTVEDDGPGIPAEKRKDALKPFTRLDPARNQNRNTGVGLGLSIAADIAKAHGGELRLGDSQRLGGLKAQIVIAR